MRGRSRENERIKRNCLDVLWEEITMKYSKR